MSRTVPASVATHIATNSTSLALCMKLVRRDTVESYHTAHDVSIVHDGNTYLATKSLTYANIKASSDIRTDDSELQGILSVSGIEQDDIRAGLYDQCEVYLFYINYKDPTAGIIKVGRGILGNFRVEDGIFTAEVRSIHQILKRATLQRFGVLCPVDLGGTKCGVDLSSYTFAGQVDVVSNDRVRITITEQSGPTITEFDSNQYFNGGKIVWTSGANNGYTCEVRRHIGSSRTIEFLVPTPYTITAGEQFNIIRGCDKTFATCTNTFSNYKNFRGFPFIPGRKILEAEFENQ